VSRISSVRLKDNAQRAKSLDTFSPVELVQAVYGCATAITLIVDDEDNREITILFARLDEIAKELELQLKKQRKRQCPA
tara:strand:- start:2448 stop:2684 length:237 start_codon:yes stop_codon:yes gene_type:complete